MPKNSVQVEWPGRESASLQVETNEQDEILSYELKGVGNSEFLSLLVNLRGSLKGRLREVPLPGGDSPAAICLREVILKSRNQWDFPFKEEELCHCRAVSTQKVDMAVCKGAHSVHRVREQTSASTACGTCRPDVEAIIKFRCT